MRLMAFMALVSLLTAPILAQSTAEVVEKKVDPTSAALLECAPATYTAAIDCLEANLPQKSLATLKKDGAVMAHFGLGMWIRNNWGLWKGGPLSASMAEQGFLHPDDMSSAILDGLVARLREESFDVDGRIESNRKYWEGATKREQIPCESERDRDDPKVKCFVDGNGNKYSEFERATD